MYKMSQGNQVLRCFSCKMFQVHLVKKTKKWECKVCKSKQSVKHIYGKGSGKDCRLHVMKLNELQLSKKENSDLIESVSFEITDPNKNSEICSEEYKEKSKWSIFIDKDVNYEGLEDEDDYELPSEMDKTRDLLKKKKKVEENKNTRYEKIFNPPEEISLRHAENESNTCSESALGCESQKMKTILENPKKKQPKSKWSTYIDTDSNDSEDGEEPSNSYDFKEQHEQKLSINQKDMFYRRTLRSASIEGISENSCATMQSKHSICLSLDESNNTKLTGKRKREIKKRNVFDAVTIEDLDEILNF